MSRWMLAGWALLSATLFFPGTIDAQAPGKRVVWIVCSQAGLPGHKTTPSESHFTGSEWLSSDKLAMALNPNKPLSSLVPGARGACMEVVFRFNKPGQWRSIVFFPRAGKGALNLARALPLAKGEVAVLRFAACRPANSKVKMRFSTGGYRKGALADDILTPLTTNPETVELTADWQTFEIPLVEDGDPIHPMSLVAPLRITATEEDNGKGVVIVLVKDVRFEVR